MKHLFAALVCAVLSLGAAQAVSPPTGGGLPVPLPTNMGGLGNRNSDGSALKVQPTFAPNLRTLSSIMADGINLKDYGTPDLLSAVGCSIAAGSTALFCPNATFVSSDVGKHADISGAGGPNVTLSTTVTAFVDAHHVTLASPASRAAGPDRISAAYASTYFGDQGSGYVPGEVVTLAGGTLASGGTPTTFRVASTQINASTVSIASSGSGGFTNTNCQLTGTTGAGVKFILKGEVSGTHLTAITFIIQPGRYTSNPTNLTNEPVTSNCGLTGAHVSIQMTPMNVDLVNVGVYSVAPPDLPTQASSTGTGTGASYNMSLGFYPTGNIQYGTDNGPAMVAAITNTNTHYANTGLPLCIFMPGGSYGIWSGTMPTFLKGGCVRGDGPNKTMLYLGATFSGTLFSWSEAWVVSADGSINWGAQSYVSMGATANGPIAHDFSVAGDISDPHPVTAFELYDHNEQVFMYNLEVSYIHGACLSSGQLLNQASGYTRESYFSNFRCYFSGTSAIPAMWITSEGNGAGPNELRFYDTNIFAPYNVGLEVSNNSFFTPAGHGAGSIAFHTLRVEGWSPPQNRTGDLVMLNNPTKQSIVSLISIDDFLGNASYPGSATLGIYNSVNHDIPYSIEVDGRVGGAYGTGINFAGGRFMQLHMQFGQFQQAITLGPIADVLPPILFDGDGLEYLLNIIIDPTSLHSLKWRPLFTLFGGGVSFNNPDGSMLGGILPSQGAIDLTTNRIDGTIGATGLSSYILGGLNNKALGSLCGTYGETNVCEGTLSNVEGWRAYDRNRYGVHCRASGFSSGVLGEMEYCDGIMRASTQSTTPTRLLTDGGPDVLTNPGDCWTIPGDYAFNMTLDITAKDTTTSGNVLTEHVVGMLDRSNTEATTTWTPMGSPATGVKGISVSPSNISIGADQTNGCLDITWTAPDTHIWQVVARVLSAESGR